MAHDSATSSTHSTPPLQAIPHSLAPQHTLAHLPTTSEPSEEHIHVLHAPNAPAGPSDLNPPNTDMEPERSNHRRRRSSQFSNTDTTKTKTTRKAHRSGSASRQSIQEDPKAEDEEDEVSEDLELDDLSEDGLQDDEETGLTAKDKSSRKKRRRRNTLLDQRIVTVTAEDQKEADQNVLRRSLVNGMLIGLWYLFSLSISIYNKWMFDPAHLDFHFPLFTTCFHMLVQFSLACCVLYFLPQFRPRHDSISNPYNAVKGSEAEALQHKEESEKPLMTKMFYFTRIGPCGMATGLDIGLGNMSLKFITLTFYTMCKSSALAFVLLFAFLFRLETPSWRLVGIIATMTFGVIMMVAGEVDFSALGFTLIISAAFFSGFRWGLTQILLLRNPATSNPFSSIFYLAPIMFASLLLLAIPVEGFANLGGGLRILIASKGPVLGPLLLLFPGCIAFCMTASEFALLQRTSVVTLSIAGIFKEVVTISAAGIVFHDPLTPINISGLFVTIGAIAAYNYMKIRKMREDARKEVVYAKVGGEDGEDGDESGSDADGEGSEMGEVRGRDGAGQDWNTVEGTYVTADGDILPNPDAFKAKKKKNGGGGGGSSIGGVVRPSGDRTRAEMLALAASKKEMSD